MGKILKRAGIVVAGLLLVLIVLPFLIDVNQFKPKLESELSAALNRDVKLGHLRLSLLAGEVTADDLSVAEDRAFGNPAFIRAKSLSVGAEIWPFLTAHRLVVNYLTIDQPEIALVQAPSGDWNFSSLGARRAAAPAATQAAPGSGQLDLSVQQVRITNGRLTMGRTAGHWKPLVLQHVNLELRQFSAGNAFPFTLSADAVGGGNIQLNGQAGPINPTDTAMTPLNATLKVKDLDLAGTGIDDFAPTLSALVSFDGSGTSDGQSLQIRGKLRAEKLKLARQGTPSARPVELDFAAQHDLRRHSGTIRQGDIHIGGALAHLTGTYAEQGPAMVLAMKLAGPQMSVPELASLLPALGVTLPAGSNLDGGTASVMLAMEGPADRLVTTGSLGLNNTRLTGFDLPRRMAAVERLAGIQGGPDLAIQTMAANVRVGPEGASAQDMQLLVPALGNVTGAGTVSPANQLDFHLSALVHTSGLLSAVGNTPIPFLVSGTCSDPVFRPDVKAVVKEKVGSIAGGLLKGLLDGKKK